MSALPSFSTVLLALVVLLLSRICYCAWTLNPQILLARFRVLLSCQAARRRTMERLRFLNDEKLWAGLVPVPLDETESPLVPIAYEPKYRKAIELIRALIKANEYSDRALRLTRAVVELNASHYSIWAYRWETLKRLHDAFPEKDYLGEELDFLDAYMPNVRKTYQAWAHRSAVIELKNDPSRELAFTKSVLDVDSKNYQTWTYRENVLCRFNRPELWQGELDFVNELLEQDIRNNSAWNHRFFLLFDTVDLRKKSSPTNIEALNQELPALVKNEVEFCKQFILKVPNNLSAWNYLRGVMKKGSVPFSSLKEFVTPMTMSRDSIEKELDRWPCDLNPESDLPAVPAVEFLADVCSQDKAQFDHATQLFALLADQLDPIRKNYWNYRSRSLVHAS